MPSEQTKQCVYKGAGCSHCELNQRTTRPTSKLCLGTHTLWSNKALAITLPGSEKENMAVIIVNVTPQTLLCVCVLMMCHHLLRRDHKSNDHPSLSLSHTIMSVL